MKVVLIDVPTSPQQLYGDWDLSAVDTYCPPLGLLYIASFIRQKSHTPYVVDIQSLKWSLDQSVDYVLSIDPDIVGISAKTINIHNANSIAKELKLRGCRAPVVVGGAHITAVPVETLEKFDGFDLGVVGEGEVTFLELLERKGNGQETESIKGIVRRSNGKVILNPARPLIKDLDALPLPAWDLLPNFPHGYRHSALETKRLPSASIVTSRGCPHKCTYCDRAVFGSTARFHSAEYSLNMIRHLKEEYGVKDLMFLDDNFLMKKSRLFEICDTIIEERMDLSWYCLCHVKFMTEERLKKIKDAGCWIMEVGIESGSERILSILGRKTPKSLIAEALAKARKAGIKVKGNFIFGLPTETLETLEETTQFALDLDLFLFQQCFMTMWPGNDLSHDAEKYGEVVTDWDKLSHFQISFVPNGLTKEDLLRASKRAFLRFYLRPRNILQVLASLTSLRAVKNAFVYLMAFIKTVVVRG